MAKSYVEERVAPSEESPPPPEPQVESDSESSFGLWTPEIAGEKGFKILLYGPSGAGKTFMAGTFPDPIFLDVEGGMRTLLPLGLKILRYPKDPKVDITDFSQIRDFYRKVKQVPADQAQFKTIVIDSLNELQVLILKNLTSKYQATRQYDDQPTMADYGKLARDMQTIVRLFTQLPYHVVFTAISSVREYPEDQVTPQFIGKKTGPDMERMMDIIGYCHVLQNKDGSLDHVVGFEHSPSYIAKDRTGKLGTVIPNNYQAMLAQVSRNGKGS